MGIFTDETIAAAPTWTTDTSVYSQAVAAWTPFCELGYDGVAKTTTTLGGVCIHTVVGTPEITDTGFSITVQSKIPDVLKAGEATTTAFLQTSYKVSTITYPAASFFDGTTRTVYSTAAVQGTGAGASTLGAIAAAVALLAAF